MTVQELIRRAYRLAGYLKMDDQPTVSEMTNGIEALQGVLHEVLVQYARLTDVIIEDDYEAGENERVFNYGTPSYTVTPPTTIEDAVTGEDRPPRNGAMIEVSDPTPQQYVWVSHFGAWKQLHDLSISDSNPLGPAHDQDLAALLAVRLSAELPAKLPAQTLALAAAGRTSIRQRFRQPIAAVTDPLLLSPRQRWT
jgi:hypothetical protein